MPREVWETFESMDLEAEGFLDMLTDVQKLSVRTKCSEQEPLGHVSDLKRDIVSLQACNQ